MMENLRILIADNESIIRMDLKELLEEAGHEIVAEAADGLKAVELTRKYSGEESCPFVNGVLGTISRKLAAQA